MAKSEQLKQIPACYFPSTVIFIDDSRDFLVNFTLQLDDRIVFKVFSSPHEALEAVHAVHLRSNFDQHYLAEYADAKNNLHFDQRLDMDFSALHYEMYNPQRYREVAVVVVDYDMPGMNGLEFCKQMENSPIKRILLTGRADEIVAIKAFNQGIIDVYLRKQDKQLAEMINRTIFNFQRIYFAAGGTLGILIPPSITMILYGIASETSIGRLFLAGVIPGILLVVLFMAWALFLSWKRGTKLVDHDRVYSMKEKLELLPKLLPFMAVIVGVVYALYGGIATPSEAAGVGAALCLVMVILIYRVWTVKELWSILRDALRESGMLLLIIGTSILFGYMMSSLQVTQAVAESIATLQVNRWVVLAAINLMLLVAGCFLPPAAIILMTTPILMPVIVSAGFDPIWFGVILTINMELGLITPPVGLNLFVINGITPDVSLGTILRGAFPFMGCMVVAILILCVFPELATWLPSHVMG